MPLLKGKPFQLLEKPKSEQIPREIEDLWRIRFTGELFSSYDDYSARLNLYRQRIWECGQTGHRQLTFEEALISEQKVRVNNAPGASGLQRLNPALQKGILELVQFSTISRMDSLCDFVFARLRDRLLEGEVVILKRDDGSTCSAVVKSVIVDTPSKQSTTKHDLDADKSMEMGGKDGWSAEDAAKYRYVISEVDEKTSLEGKELVTVGGDCVSRVRNALSKAVIRAIIKESSTKETFYGAPWIVNEDLAKELGINTQPPAELWDEETNTFKRRSKKSRTEADYQSSHEAEQQIITASSLPKPKYPIEDTEVPILSRRAHPEMETSAVPLPKNDYEIQFDCVPDMIQVWTFLFVFARPLNLFPFSLDDFEQSLKQSQLPLNSIITQVHSVLLKNAADNTASFIQRLTKQGVKPKKLLAKSSTTSKQKSDSTPSNDQQQQQLPVESSVGVNGVDPASTDEELDIDYMYSADITREDNLIVNVMDYSYVGMWWKWKIDDQSWMSALIAYFLHLVSVREFPALVDIMRILADEEPIMDSVTGRLFFQNTPQPWKNKNLLERYCLLDVSQKLQILAFLIEESVSDCPEIRKFVDDSLSDLVELKKEKRELETKKREMLEEQRVLDQEMNPTADSDKKDTEHEPEKKTKSAAVNDEDDDEDVGEAIEEEEDESSSGGESDNEEKEEEDYLIEEIREKLAEYDEDTTEAGLKLSRQEKVRLQNQLKELEDAQRREKLEKARAIARERNARLREHQSQKRKLDSDMEKILKRDFTLDRELRAVQGCIRIKPLGKDRFWNRYWWIDGYGSGVGAIAEYGVYGKGMLSYGSGRLWVEGAGQLEYLGLVSGGDVGALRKRRRAFESTLTDPFVTLPANFYKSSKKAPGSDIGENWLKEGEWRYYDSVEQIDELLCWLNPKGVREQMLKTMVTKYYDHITHSIGRRVEDLERQVAEIEHVATATTRETRKQKGSAGATVAVKESKEPWMLYKNRWSTK